MAIIYMLKKFKIGAVMKIKVGDSLDNIKLTSIDDKIFELKKVLKQILLIIDLQHVQCAI